VDTTPDRRVEEARASLLAHVEELGRRIHDAKAKLDIPAHIAAHPRAAVGIALAVGALLGIPGKRVKPGVPSSDAKTGMMGAAMATLGTLAFTLMKNVAMHHLSGVAKDWWDQRSMENASHTTDVESFLEH